MKIKSFVCSAALALTAILGLSARAEDTVTKVPWTGSVAAGLTFTRGNSRTLLGTVNVEADKKTKEDGWLLGAGAAYGKNTGVVNAKSIDGHGQYNRLLTERWYYGAKLDGLSDGVAGINYRLTLSPLAGYYLIKGTNDNLAVEAGPSAVIQKLGPTTTGYAALRFGERYDHKISSTAKLWQSFEFYPQVDKFKNYYWTAEIGVEAAITQDWSLRSFIQDSYYAIPAAGRLKNDIKLVTGIAYKF